MIIVDETADLKDAADKIMRSKTFDHATSCSTENSLAIQEGIYDRMIKELQAVGGYLCNAEEKEKLQKAMWDEKGVLSREIVAQPAEKIAKVAGHQPARRARASSWSRRPASARATPSPPRSCR